MNQLTLWACCVCLLGTGTAGAEETPDLAPLVELLGQVDDAEFQLDLLKGMLDGLKGRKTLPMPAAWPDIYRKLAVSPNADVQAQAKYLALVFDDPTVLKQLRETLLNAEQPAKAREEALTHLVSKQVPGLDATLLKLLDDAAVRGAAIRGLAGCENAVVPAALLERYPQCDESQRQDVINTLSSRPAWALELLTAVAQKRLAHGDISAFTARQLQTLNDERINAKLKELWGDIQQTPAEKKQLIDKYKQMLTPATLAKADLSQGRVLFGKTCLKCHVLHEEGGKIGPGLTGSNRANLDYILENVIAPSAVIGRDYQLMIAVTVQGRSINGIVTEETDRSYTFQTVNEKLVVSKDDIDLLQRSPVSMMPEGQFEKLTPEEIRDLVGYLASPGQVPLPENAPKTSE